ncbi:hypothetical protein D9M68_767250 [compost metagenome]
MVIRIGALAHLQLPQQHGARLAQAADDGGVMVCRHAAVEGGARRRRHALAPEQVFQCEGHAMQRAPVAAAADLGRGGFGLAQRRRRRHAGIAAQGAIQFVDPLQLGLRDLDGRDVAGPDQGGQRGQVQVMEWGGRCGVLLDVFHVVNLFFIDLVSAGRNTS